MTTSYERPPRRYTEDGEVRRVGIEVELTGLTVSALAELVADVVGGRLEVKGRTEATVAGTRYGDFRIELDARPLQERKYLEPLESLGVDPDALDRIERTVVDLAREVVPLEVVTPPVPVDRLHELDPLWARIRDAGGLGTGASMRYAFGLHLNPDLPGRIDAASILAHLQAYFLLEDRIAEAENVDWTRRVVPFIDPFPEAYRRQVLDEGYAPTLDQLITDYLALSPTRNRVLDLLPLFVHLRPDCLKGRAVEGAELVAPRPTFHYRLPNCEIEQAGWTPAPAWNRWLEVERLAAEPSRRRSLASAYLDLVELPLRLHRHRWIRRLAEECA